MTTVTMWITKLLRFNGCLGQWHVLEDLLVHDVGVYSVSLVLGRMECVVWWWQVKWHYVRFWFMWLVLFLGYRYIRDLYRSSVFIGQRSLLQRFLGRGVVSYCVKLLRRISNRMERLKRLLFFYIFHCNVVTAWPVAAVAVNCGAFGQLGYD